MSNMEIIKYTYFSVLETQRQSSLFVKHTKPAAVKNCQKTECGCPQSCVKQLPEEYILHARTEFWGKSTQQRRGAVFSELKSSLGRNGKLIHNLDLDGNVIIICGQAWKNMLSVPKNMYYYCLKAAKERSVVQEKMPRARSSKPARGKEN